jgi:hypothetical protein
MKKINLKLVIAALLLLTVAGVNAQGVHSEIRTTGDSFSSFPSLNKQLLK